MKKERLHILDRMGVHLPFEKRNKSCLWIHAVSVGEVMSLQSLVKRIKKIHPDWIIYFSTLTNSGYQVAEEKLKCVDELFFVPFDFKFIVRKFFRIIRPDLFILTESEFWPNLLREAQRCTKGVLLVNGRVSSSSYKRYGYVKGFMRRILAEVDLFLVQTEEDRRRLHEIGALLRRIRVAGNLKAEINLKEMTENDVLRLRQELNIERNQKTVVAGSTRKGEDKILLTAFSKAFNNRKDIKFIIAPRHMDRVEETMKQCEALGLRAVKKTCLEKKDPWEVLVLDTIGELARIYAVADSAIIGGSLVPWGGQNLLEPAFYSKPIFFGPHMDNFAYFADVFLKAGGAKVVWNEKDLINVFLFKDLDKMSDMGRKAKETLNSLQGATSKTLQAIESMMFS